MGRKTVSLIIINLLISALLAGCTFSKSQPVVIHSIYEGDAPMWNKIFSAEPEPESYFTSAPAGIILPHHMIVAEELTKAYKKLQKTANPSTIVIIGPNHYESGNAFIQTCISCQYETIEGQTPIDKKLTKKLLQSNLASHEPQTFIKEHSIHAHTPFIKKFFPRAKILPIILKWETPEEKTTELAQWLKENLPEDSLVIASVDFSHYIPVKHANFHDISSYATIKNFDYKNIYDLEIDSPASISTITHLMELKGAMKINRFAHTSNQQFHKKSLEETTSHQFIGFFKGKKELEQSFTIFASSPIPGIPPGFYDSYRWDIHTPPNTPQNTIRGKEDRMIVGADVIIFGTPEKKTITQNGITITFSGDPSDIKKTKDPYHFYVIILEGKSPASSAPFIKHGKNSIIIESLSNHIAEIVITANKIAVQTYLLHPPHKRYTKTNSFLIF